MGRHDKSGYDSSHGIVWIDQHSTMANIHTGFIHNTAIDEDGSTKPAFRNDAVVGIDWYIVGGWGNSRGLGARAGDLDEFK